MKPSTLLLIAALLFLVIFFFALVSTEAAQVEAEWWLQDTSTVGLSGFVRDLWDGTRIDLKSFDVEGYRDLRGVRLGLLEPHH